jgi:UDPglucose 6-dehydrogenase
MKISIIGSGYVGLVSGACFSSLGHTVTCLDINKSKIQLLNKGKSFLYEPGLDKIVKSGLKNKRLKFTTSYSKACKSDLVVLCIDTPEGKGGNPDLKNLKACLHSLVRSAKKDFFLVTKSTVPIGTNKYIQSFINKNTNQNIEVISNPEFLKEGSAINDFFKPDRIIVGCHSLKSQQVMKKLYQKLHLDSHKIIFMSIESAELTKYAANAFLATKISFINQISQVAEKIGANIHEIKKGIGTDPRIGESFLNAGLGYGGSCFPKDVQALINQEKKLNFKYSLLQATEAINNQQAENFYKKILESYKNKKLSNVSFLIWGLSFKPNTDDIRESIGIKLVHFFSKQVKALYLYDPIAMNNSANALKDLKNIIFCQNSYDHIEHANALIICTEWDIFLTPDLVRLRLLKDQKIFDGRNILDHKDMTAAGIEYFGIGI